MLSSNGFDGRTGITPTEADFAQLLLDRLDALEWTDNTLVVFTAEKGTNRRIHSQRNGERCAEVRASLR
ncbi:hypothetical protein [Aurantiacibacter flavus]|uniref:Uncharacterized protein n=1 Tax=Aurantiacibacter flavus TaxID=3145232 RepID=A0ABV0CRV4_9SPHN